MLFLIWTLLAFANEEVNGHKCHGHENGEWSYDDQKAWAEHYPACNGTRQSPINIITSEVEEDPNLSDLTFTNYNKPVSGNLTNNGHTAQLTVTDGEERKVQGTRLPKGCIFKQLHFHWGSTPTSGSEHRINRRRFSMEGHMVHQCNENKLLVLAVLFERCAPNNPELREIVKPLKSVKHKGKQTVLKNSFNLEKLLPKNRKNFYHYSGSLTTPGCDEVVTWIVFGDPLCIGDAQIQEFRSLYSNKESDEHQCKLSDNCRHIQHLNDRKVTSLRVDYKR